MALKLLKFHEDDRLELFDIESDISEQNDLSQRMPAKTRELDRMLVSYLNEIDAQMATPNPQYDPTRAPATRKRDSGNKRPKPNKRVKPRPKR